MKPDFYRSRILRFGAVLLVAIVLVGFARGPILRGIGSFLFTEGSLEPSAAIVVLGGQMPFREMEAARLFTERWAPKVIVIPGALREEQRALSELGKRVPEGWEISRESSVRVQQKTLMTTRDIADTILKA